MPLTTLLRCNDLADTASFYREVLGFTVAESAESTITVRLEDCSLTFTQAYIWGRPVAFSGTLYFAIAQVDRYYQSLKDQVDLAWPLQDMPYGSREFGLRDCNGYYLAFAQLNTANHPSV
ncbi:Glyoxalase-like domain protein [compost metagenome]